MPLLDEARASDSRTETRSAELTVHIHAYARDGRWYAEALDLALIGEGTTEDEAVRCLLEAVAAYVRTVVSRGWLDQLQRPVTRRHRLAIRARVLLGRFRRPHPSTRTELVHI